MKDKIFATGKLNTVLYTDSSRDTIDGLAEKWSEKQGTNVISATEVNSLTGLLSEIRRERKTTINKYEISRLPVGVSPLKSKDTKLLTTIEASDVVVMYDEENNDFLILKRRGYRDDIVNTKVTIDQLV